VWYVVNARLTRCSASHVVRWGEPVTSTQGSLLVPWAEEDGSLIGWLIFFPQGTSHPGLRQRQHHTGETDGQVVEVLLPETRAGERVLRRALPVGRPPADLGTATVG